MNVIGDEAFNMYLNAENAKPQQRTLNLDEIISGLRPSYELRDTGYCYCASNRADAAPVPAEEKHVTEILISSLNISNAEHVLSLTQNYVVEEMMFSEVALRAFFAFLANTSNGVAAKARIHSVLQEHLRLHPSCAAHMVHRYHELMLSRDEEFSGVTLLEYVICKLEQLVSVQNEVRISSTRTSRRRRRPVRMADESPAKRPARVVVFNEAAEDDETQPTETKEQPPELENLVKVLTYLIRIMRHDLGYTLKRRQPVRDCIVAKLMLAGDAESAVTTLNQALLTGICEVLKHGDTQPVLLGVSDLLGLVADVCALQEAEARGCFDVEQPGLDCRTLISAFCVAVVGEKPALGKLLPVLRQLKPQWLQYHVTKYLMEKVFCRKLPNGLRGVTCVFMAIHKNIRERVMDTTKILKLVDNNQLAAAEIVTTGAKKSVKSERDGYAAHETDKNGGLAKSEIKCEIAADEEKGIEFNVRQKLTPIVCNFLILFVSSTNEIVKLVDENSLNSTDNDKLKNLLNELCGDKKIPVEMNVLRRHVNKIF